MLVSVTSVHRRKPDELERGRLVLTGEVFPLVASSEEPSVPPRILVQEHRDKNDRSGEQWKGVEMS